MTPAPPNTETTKMTPDEQFDIDSYTRMKMLQQHKRRAWRCALLSNAVYKNEIGGKDLTDDYMEGRFIQNDNATAFLAEFKEFRALGFRGTNQGKDWIANLDARKNDTGTCHNGFHRHYRKFDPKMTKLMKFFTDQYGSKPVCFTGHSLGGAVAVLAALDFMPVGYSITAYTFGAPRVLSLKGAMGYPKDVDVVRFRNNNDHVPRLPKAWMGFKHTGKEFYIDSNGRVHEDASFCQRFIDRLRGYRKDGLSEPVDDHDMQWYLRHIGRWAHE